MPLSITLIDNKRDLKMENKLELFVPLLNVIFCTAERQLGTALFK